MLKANEKDLASFLGEKALNNPQTSNKIGDFNPVSTLGGIESGLNTASGGLDSLARIMESIEKLANSPLIEKFVKPKDELINQRPQVRDYEADRLEALASAPQLPAHVSINQEKAPKDKPIKEEIAINWQKKAQDVANMMGITISELDDNMTLKEFKEQYGQLKPFVAGKLKEVLEHEQ